MSFLWLLGWAAVLVCGTGGLLMGGLGLFLVVAAWWERRTYAALRGWPSAPGQIKTAELVRNPFWLRFGRSHTYSVGLSYDYSVAGAPYVGHAINVEGLRDDAAARAFVQQHPAGSQVTVFYNPTNPRQVYLDRDSAPTAFWPLASLVTLAVAAPGCLALFVLPYLLLAPASAPQSLPANVSRVDRVAFSPDGHTLAGGGCGQVQPASSHCLEGGVFLWDVSNLNAPRALGAAPTGRASGVTAVAFSADGATVVDGNGDYTLGLWSVSNSAAPHLQGEPLQTDSEALSLTFSPVGKILAAGEYDNRIQLWDLSDPSAPRALGKTLTELPGPVDSLAFSPDGKLLAAEGMCVSASANPCPPAITLWDTASPASPRAVTSAFGGPGPIFAAVAFSPDGKRLAANLAGQSLGLWDLSDLAQPRLLGSPLAASSAALGLAFSADGKTLAVIDGITIDLWDVSNPLAARQVGWINLATGADSIAFSAQSPTLAAASNGNIMLWDVSKPASPRQLGRPLATPLLGASR